MACFAYCWATDAWCEKMPPLDGNHFLKDENLLSWRASLAEEEKFHLHYAFDGHAEVEDYWSVEKELNDTRNISSLLERLLEPSSKLKADGDDEVFWDTPAALLMANILVWPLALIYCLVLVLLNIHQQLWSKNIWKISKGLKRLCNPKSMLLRRNIQQPDESHHRSGLYWYSFGNVVQRDDDDEKGGDSRYFDPTKPSVIYVHGYQPRTIIRRFRESLNWADNDREFGIDVNAADQWLKQGWNVGIFYWNMFADEDTVFDAEAKIWANDTPVGMRSRVLSACGKSVKWRYTSMSTPPCIAQQLAEILKRRFPRQSEKQKQPTYRLVGHSLGSQLVIHAAKLMHDEKQKIFHQSKASAQQEAAVDDSEDGQINSESPNFILPSRIALLDPFFTLEPKRYLKWRTVGSILAEEVELLSREEDIVFEQYQSSILSFAASQALRPYTAFFELNPAHIPWYKFRARHLSATYLYFMSFGFEEIGQRAISTIEGPWLAHLSHCSEEDYYHFFDMAKSRDEDLKVLMHATIVDDLYHLFTSYKLLVV